MQNTSGGAEVGGGEVGRGGIAGQFTVEPIQTREGKKEEEGTDGERLYGG